MDLTKWATELKNQREKIFFPIVTYPGLQITGNSIKEATYSGKIQFECMKALNKRFPDMPALPMSMDLSLEAEAFGAPVKFSDDEVPTIMGKVINSYEEIASLQVPQPNTERINEFIKAAQLAADSDFGKPVFTGCIGPFSLAGRLLDITEIMMGLLMYPDEVNMLVDKSTQFIIDFLKKLKATGADGVIMAEPAAGLLEDNQCEEFSSQYIKKIVDEIQDDSFLIMLHNCGNTETLVKSMAGTGAAALHFGNAVNMKDIIHQVPSDVLVFGNLDPANLIKTGSPESIKEAVKKLREETSGYDNFILSSGCDIPPGTALENIEALFV
ncbi:MAG: uroporphyrinogen decarboxylase family protein [Prolixibacteraceae bacterium]|jgi:uroporphyrinogen decarboxylase|nr:uroporphyrinogen decarboxylase family protein [Prolixibacteraceae bacterium]